MRSTQNRWVARLAIACFITMMAGCEDSPPPSLGGGSVATWTAWGGKPGGTHYSSATQITPENVRWLELAWEHRSGDIRKARGPSDGRPPTTNSGFQATPIVIDDTLSYCSSFNKVFAIDAETGEEKWRFDPKVDRYEGQGRRWSWDLFLLEAHRLYTEMGATGHAKRVGRELTGWSS